MPYINLNTNKQLAPEQKQTLKTQLGDLISILPGKTAEQTLIKIADECDMYRRGFDDALCMIEIYLYQMQPFGCKADLTKAIVALMEKDYGIPAPNLYIKFDEMPVWGVDGALK
ncbi:MAG: hypothetical protein VB081_06425 [Christensenella sp.]|uniref:tautomerase family protein n=1 Tax=Christensenella sp. TaxID=1935934 RepID=UPI002B20FF92|nr:hypothetical protein [Christensenella sp.]MEA5003117.1 hypothetical protein [Christensenella sp.]